MKKPDLEQGETTAVEGGTISFARLVACVHRGQLMVVAGGEDGRRRVLALDEHGRRAEHEVEIELDTPTAAASCGDRLLIAGTKDGGWRLLVLEDRATLVVPPLPIPLCRGGVPVVASWERGGSTLAVSEVAGAELTEAKRIELGGPTPERCLTSFGDGIAVLRAGAAAHPIELLYVAGGEVRARVSLPGTEGAVAPGLAAVGANLVGTWSLGGRMQMEWFDEALSSRLREDAASLGDPRSFAATFAVRGDDDAILTGYVEKLRLGPTRVAGARGTPVAFRRTAWAATYDVETRRMGPYQLIGDGDETSCHRVGGAWVVLERKDGSLRATRWTRRGALSGT